VFHLFQITYHNTLKTVLSGKNTYPPNYARRHATSSRTVIMGWREGGDQRVYDPTLFPFIRNQCYHCPMTRLRHTYCIQVSQEECARLREGVPYVKVHRHNPKQRCPKMKGYGDNGQRKVWSSGGSTHCTCQLTSLIEVRP
jgi:hypothetical protein